MTVNMYSLVDEMRKDGMTITEIANYLEDEYGIGLDRVICILDILEGENHENISN